MRSVLSVLSALALACVAVFGATARAANIDHFAVSTGPHNFLVTPDAQVLPHLTPSVWVVAAWAKDPLVYRDDAGAPVAKIVEHAISARLVAGLGLYDKFEVALSVPSAGLIGPGFDGRAGTADDFGGFSLSDPRLHGRFLFTDKSAPVQALAHLDVDLPLAQVFGGTGRLLGRTLPALSPGIAVAYHHPLFKVGVDVAADLAVPDTAGDARNGFTIGSALRVGLGAEAPLVKDLLAGTADIYGRAAPQFLGNSETQLPLEAALGLKGFFGPWVVTGGLGTGLVADYGAPSVRVFLGAGYAPRAPGDADNDGITDDVDQCKDAAEDKDGYQDADGCPDPDNDGDGILDTDDKCPDAAETQNGIDDTDGCPDALPLDTDSDGVADDKDACPKEPEDKDGFEDDNGCPDPDNDGDGILDATDKCPNEAETKNEFQDADGCPDVAPKKTIIKVTTERLEIKDKIQFAFNSDIIDPVSYPLLDDVYKVLQEHPEQKLVHVEGHSSDEGTDAYNLDLSTRRAQSVMRYLVKKGVDAGRLDAQGFGESKPVTSDTSPTGRALNRRVEFRINEDAPAAGAP